MLSIKLPIKYRLRSIELISRFSVSLTNQAQPKLKPETNDQQRAPASFAHSHIRPLALARSCHDSTCSPRVTLTYLDPPHRLETLLFYLHTHIPAINRSTMSRLLFVRAVLARCPQPSVLVPALSSPTATTTPAAAVALARRLLVCDSIVLSWY